MVKLTRIAISHNPQALLVEYTKEEDYAYSYNTTKRFHKRITFPPGIIDDNDDCDHGMDASIIAVQLRQQFPKYFDKEQVSLEQVSDLIQCLKDESKVRVRIVSCIENNADNDGNAEDDAAFDLDLNKVTEEQLKEAKAQMEVIYDEKRLKPDDSNYEYDKRVDYDPESDSSWD